MKFNWPWSKTYQVKCADGSSRTVYRNIDDACPLYISGWKGDISADLRGISELSGEAKAKYETQIHGLLFSLNEQNQSLMMSFRTIYLAFTSHPCGNDQFFQREIEKMLDEQRKISALKMQIAALIQFASNSPGDTEQLASIFNDIASRLGTSEAVTPAASMQIAETRNIAKDLLNG
jgi:hypothetical protein